MTRAAIRLDAIGRTAHAALARAGGRAEVLARLTAAIFLGAAGEIVWLGPAGASLHRRAMLTREPLPAGASAIVLDHRHLVPWEPPRIGETAPSVLGESTRQLLAAIRAMAGDAARPDRARRDGARAALGAPLGLGALLVGRRPDGLLDGATVHAHAFAVALAEGGARALAAADPLLGLGPGLTPSGDDFVGGALFAQASLQGPPAAGWRDAVADLRVRAAARTNRISAALLGDLAHGHGHAPLHELARALVAGAATDAEAAAARLVVIGHSSGWDLLAGFVAAILGPRAFGPAT